MPILLLGAIALFGLGYWEYKRGAFGAKTPKLPPALPPNATPQQVVALDAPALANEILDLLYNGQDPRAMHAVAGELEKDGFFDAAAILHKRAGELELAQAHAQAPQVPQGAPGAPGAPTVPFVDAAIQSARNQIAQLNVAYNDLDNRIKAYLVRVTSPTNPSPQFLLNSRPWSSHVAQWRNFQVEGLTAQNLQQMLQTLATYGQALADWEAALRQELGAEARAPVPQSAAATGPRTSASNPYKLPVYPGLFSGEGDQ